MNYTVEYSQRAVKFLKKLDRPTKERLKSWIDTNLAGCADPFNKGKALSGNKRGYWRYRVENYRIICEVEQGRLLITIIDIGHRSNIYISNPFYVPRENFV